jgi:hypothetical protein
LAAKKLAKQHLLLASRAMDKQITNKALNSALHNARKIPTDRHKVVKAATVQRKADRTDRHKVVKAATVQHKADKTDRHKVVKALTVQHKVVKAATVQHKADKTDRHKVVRVVQEAAVEVAVHQHAASTKVDGNTVRLHSRKWNCHYRKKLRSTNHYL